MNDKTVIVVKILSQHKRESKRSFVQQWYCFRDLLNARMDTVTEHHTNLMVKVLLENMYIWSVPEFT